MDYPAGAEKSYSKLQANVHIQSAFKPFLKNGGDVILLDTAVLRSTKQILAINSDSPIFVTIVEKEIGVAQRIRDRIHKEGLENFVRLVNMDVFDYLELCRQNAHRADCIWLDLMSSDISDDTLYDKLSVLGTKAVALTLSGRGKKRKTYPRRMRRIETSMQTIGLHKVLDWGYKQAVQNQTMFLTVFLRQARYVCRYRIQTIKAVDNSHSHAMVKCWGYPQKKKILLPGAGDGYISYNPFCEYIW